MIKIVFLDPKSPDAMIIGKEFIEQANRIAELEWIEASFMYVQDLDAIARCLEEERADYTLIPLEDSKVGDLPLVWRLFKAHNLFIVKEILCEQSRSQVK